ncbi:hypothetical protein GPM19_10200 [Halomonas sp. ZH2S]|uniref:Uncharacterized protein n=1 Tax=Vreelandella zhuhanensis TaxID=2684210 RepID=A0A7X3KS00_9GAMM|nr:hypothetical protein [Halomonas zhuhanensis]MWJ28572.1 hypothetical protein [Halomonas zhuhanensis]
MDLEPIIKSYYKLLQSLDWSDEVLIRGLREGLNKFPSNAFLRMNPESKYLCGDYYSPSALEKVQSRNFSGLIFEHMVPKAKYIQKPCEQAAREGSLDINEMRELFQKYWKIAVITVEENSRLKGHAMPKDWDFENIFSRYQESGIELVKNIS